MYSLEDLGWNPSLHSEFASWRAEGLEPARVAEEHRNGYRVLTPAGTCSAAMSGRLHHALAERGDRPAVGDWVAIATRPAEGAATVHAILTRRTALRRKTAGAVTEVQVVAANVDVGLVVSSLNRDFNPRRIERMLALVWDGGARPVVVLSKLDLCDDPAARVAEAEAAAPGVAVIALSAHSGAGLDALREHLPARTTAALLGSSGVGKSSLINRLLGAEVQAVRAIREDDDRGRHATTGRHLFALPGGALVVDTPGMREIALWDGGLDGAFPEVDSLVSGCRFRDCGHGNEPGCAVRAALESGTLDPARWAGWVKLQRELAFQSRRVDERARLAEKKARIRLHREYRNRPHRRT